MNMDEMSATIRQLELNQERMCVWAENVDKAIDKQDKILERVQSIADAVRDQANVQTNMVAQVTQVRKDLDDIKCTPAKRWEMVVAGVITGLLSIAVGKFANLF